jgi:murein L,D-transpeptidase YafK
LLGVRPLLLCIVVVFASGAHAIDNAESVLVVKGERRLYLLIDDEPFASFPVTFGSNPDGHKQEEGDGRTPEGEYVLDYKNSSSSYYRSIHVSYPNADDLAAAHARSVSAGGHIMIHGQKNGWESLSWLAQFVNWTDGCVALSNSDMDLVWEAVAPGTPIEIRP